ncbi:hypothetical protein PWT90_08498 [Aphanocladium album]|nr:hypothetical protein PWT90_08498 [Aphanocladium album]
MDPSYLLLPDQLFPDAESSASNDFSSSFHSIDDPLFDFTFEHDFGPPLSVNPPIPTPLEDDTPATPEQAHATPVASGGIASLQPSRQEWDRYKPTIAALYLGGKRTKEIVQTMRDEHDFHASVKQYQSRFRTWQLKKNMKSDEMCKIIQIQKWRKEVLGKESEFQVRDKLVSKDKIRKFLRRNGNTVKANGPAWPPPPHILVKTPPHKQDSNSTSGNESRQQEPAYAAQVLPLLPSAAPKIYVFDSFMQKGTQEEVATRADSSISQERRMQLGLGWVDLDGLSSFRTNSSEAGLQRSIQNVQLLMQAEPARSIPYRRCGRCGHLPAIPETSKLDLVTLFDGNQSKLNMADASLVRALQLAIKHNEAAMVVYLSRRCQHSTFMQRLHPSLLCIALHHKRDGLFRWLLLHGIDADTGSLGASKQLLTHARLALRDFITALFKRGGDGSVDDAAAFLYRARVITENHWKTKLLWAALRHNRHGILRVCLDQPTYAALDVDELMDKAEDIRKIIRETGSTEAAARLVTAVKLRHIVSENGATALHLAAALLLDEEVHQLLFDGVDADAAMETGETSLHILAGLSDNSVCVAQIFFAANANVSATDCVGDTPLHNVARHALVPWRQNFIYYLLQAHADINARNHRGETPLIVAAMNVELEAAEDAMQWLINNGAHEEAFDDAENTAQHYLQARLNDRIQCQREEEEFFNHEPGGKEHHLAAAAAAAADEEPACITFAEPD